MACNIMMYQKHLSQFSSPAAHIYLSNLGEAEKAYYQFVTSGEKNFVDAAYEVAKNKTSNSSLYRG